MWRAADLKRAFSVDHSPIPSLAPEPRASFELSSDARDREDAEAVRVRLSQSGLSPSPCPNKARKSASFSREELEAYPDQWLPSALGRMAECKAMLNGKRLAIFLDYDGTLTPIVANPDEAFLSQQMREAVRDIALLFPTAIISGRGREKVESFVQLKELYYAGSHGMDIVGPSASGASEFQSLDASFQPAAHFRPVIDAVYEELCDRLKNIPGSSVEHNTFCVSAHFRNCPVCQWQEVVSAVEAVVASNQELRITRGRKVLEVRPKVNWNKGTALEHLLGMLGLKGEEDVVTMYIGDDQTDEDAFRVLKETDQGWGILVSKKPKETAARYAVRDPTEVLTLLQALVAWGKTEHNGWTRRAAGQQQQQGPLPSTHHSPHHTSPQPPLQGFACAGLNGQGPAHLQHSSPHSQTPIEPGGRDHSPPHAHLSQHQAQPPVLPYHLQQPPRWGAAQSQGLGRQCAGPPASKKPTGFWCGSTVNKGGKSSSNGAIGDAGTVGAAQHPGSLNGNQ